MTKWTAITLDGAPDVAAYPSGRTVTGPARMRRLSPDDYSLWACHVMLEAGSQITWPFAHSDDAIYLLGGSLDVDGTSVPAGGAVIVERDAHPTLTAVGDVEMMHFGAYASEPPRAGPLGPPESPADHVHVVGPEGRHVSGSRENVHAVWFADGTCPTSRVQLFDVNSPANEETRGKAHHHSEDEIIVLMDGSVSMGSHHFSPLSALSIPGDVRYALVGGPTGHRFLNFRRDVSIQVYARGSEPLLETALARGGRASGDVG